MMNGKSIRTGYQSMMDWALRADDTDKVKKLSWGTDVCTVRTETMKYWRFENESEEMKQSRERHTEKQK
jgi:hypothetical protein